MRIVWILLAVALLLRGVFFFSPDFSNDLYRYVWEGRIQWQGANPFAIAPDDAPEELRSEHHDQINHPDLPTIYPPLAQYFFAGVARLGVGEIGMRNAVLLLDMALCVLLCLWIRRWWVAIYLLHPLTIASAGTGHIEPLMLLALVGTAWAWEKQRFRWAALLFAFAILAKTVAVIALPWFLLRRPKETLAITLPVTIAAYLPFMDADVTATLVRFGSGFEFNSSLFRLVGLPVAAAMLVIWTALVTVTQPRLPQALALLFAGLLLLSPTVHTWYLGWFLVMLAAIGVRRWMLPLLTWSGTACLVGLTYWAHAQGRPFEERTWVTIVEYGVPFALGLFLIVRGWPSRSAPIAPGTGAPANFGVVIPCRGERRNLKDILPHWLETPVEEIVVADTPTDDGTERLCRGDLRITYLAVPRSGYGAAVRAGLAQLRARADFAVVCDADHALGSRQVEALLAPFADPRVGLVCGARVATPDLTKAQRFGNRLACTLIAFGWGRHFADLGPFRAVRFSHWPRDSVRDLSYGWNVEMNVRALENGMEIVEVALPAGKRRHGENIITGTWRGVVGAGWGMLSKLYTLREETQQEGTQPEQAQLENACEQPSSS